MSFNKHQQEKNCVKNIIFVALFTESELKLQDLMD